MIGSLRYCEPATGNPMVGKDRKHVVKEGADAREKTSSGCERKRAEGVRTHQGERAAFRTVWWPGEGSGCANRAEEAQGRRSQQRTLEY